MPVPGKLSGVDAVLTSVLVAFVTLQLIALGYAQGSFAELFAAYGTDLPLPTQVLLSPWALAIALAPAVVGGAALWLLRGSEQAGVRRLVIAGAGLLAFVGVGFAVASVYLPIFELSSNVSP